MSKKSLLAALGLAVALLVMAWVVISDSVSITKDAHDHHGDEVHAVTYVSKTEGSVSVLFLDDHADFSGLGYTDLTLAKVPADTGAKYENRAENLVLWQEYDSLTVYRGDETIFTGVEESHLENEHDTPAINVPDVGIPMALDPAVHIYGQTWLWQETITADGSIIRPTSTEAFSITFVTDGSLRGTTDCNSFGGSYTVANGAISIGPLASTKMYCEGSLENTFTGVLTSNTLTAHVVTDDELHLFTDSHQTVKLLRKI